MRKTKDTARRLINHLKGYEMFVKLKMTDFPGDAMVNLDHIAYVMPDDDRYMAKMIDGLCLNMTKADYKEMVEVLRVHKLLIAVRPGEKPAL